MPPVRFKGRIIDGRHLVQRMLVGRLCRLLLVAEASREARDPCRHKKGGGHERQRPDDRDKGSWGAGTSRDRNGGRPVPIDGSPGAEPGELRRKDSGISDASRDLVRRSRLKSGHRPYTRYPSPLEITTARLAATRNLFTEDSASISVTLRQAYRLAQSKNPLVGASGGSGA